MRGIHSGLIFFFTVFLGLQPILPQTVAAESAPPGFFQQLEPADAAIDVPITPTLSWNVANRATDYGYCIDTTDDDACTGGDSGYIRVQDTSATPHLLPQTTYYWNIRAYNAFGFTTSGTWQQFTTTTTTKDISSPITAGSVSMPLQDAHTGTMAGMADDSALPGVLNKIAPTNGGVDQPTTVLLSWSEASEATSYGYCFDTTADNACDEGDERGFRRIAGTSVRISGLELGTTYFWQVRAYNATGHIQADGGQWASFTTAPVSILPEDFTKLSPATGITNVGTTVDLTWSASPDAAGYGYCINQNPSYACEGGDQGYIATPHTTVTVSDLKPGVIYYWQVRAYNAAGDYIPADGVGQWANFTTAPRVLDRPIAFLSTRDGNFEIYTMTPDGAESVRLTNDPATESFAAWSPDGRQLAFTSDRSGNNDIYVMNADGSAVTQVTSDPAHDSYPSWSPDGSRLVFQSDRTGSTDIYAINTDGSSPTRLTTDAAPDFAPNWSPDGQHIVFSTRRHGDDEIYIMNPDGNIQTRLTSSVGGDIDAVWSPDSRRIAFVSWRDGNAELYLMNADGSAQTRLTTLASDEQYPSWSPDGTHLIFTSNQDTNWNIYLMSIDSTWQTQLIHTASAETQPIWSPVVAGPMPGTFEKRTPEHDATAESTVLTLSWEGAQHAQSYGYCIDTTDDQRCDGGPVGFVRVDTTEALVNLAPNTTYYWQARAYSNGGFIEADQAAWGRFSTAAVLNDAGSFTRMSPPNGTAIQSHTTTLSWSTVSGATGYGYCIDTINNDTCDTSYVDTGTTSAMLDLEVGKTYYWHVQAYTPHNTLSANGDGAWWSLTTQSSTTPGYTPGDFGVNEAGAAHYTIPLIVPQGTAGIAPELSLAYDNRSGNSLLGRGWSIAGLSMISRCPSTRAQNGFIDGIDFDKHDQFCLDGQLLVAVEGAYGEDETVYRTENETFSKVVSYGTADRGPDRFKVWTQAGLIMEYGFTTDSRVEAQGRLDALYWALNRIEDTQGNYLVISYAEDPVNGETYPTHIDYTGNDSQGLAPYSQVIFRYEDRPDTAVQYIGGSATRMTQRLHSIRMTVDGVLAHEYRLGYDVSIGTGRSRLVSLTECAGDGTCFAPSRFDWSALTSEDFTFWGEGTGQWQGHAGGVANTRTGDFNGDGLTDMLGGTYASNESLLANAFSNWQDWVCISTGSGFDCRDWGGPDNTSRFVGDFNGDGLSDTTAYIDNGDWLVCLSTGSGFNCQTWHGHGGGPQNNALGDYNGDGLTDMAAYGHLHNGDWLVCLSTGSGFNCHAWHGHEGGVTDNVLGDFNGDGRIDLARTHEAFDTEWWVFLARGDLPDMLTTITNSSGVEIDIEYRPLTDSSVYTKSSGAAYPDADIQAPMYVVAAHTSSDGIGGKRQVTYHYEGLKINRHGRGFLGFQSITSTDETTGISSITYYSQVHPYKSMVLKTEQRLSDGTLLHSVENTWAVLSYNQFSQSNPRYLLALAGSPGSRAPPAGKPGAVQPGDAPFVAGSTPTPGESIAANELVYLPLVLRGNSGSLPPDPEPTPEPDPQEPLPPADPIEADHSFGMPSPRLLSLPDLPLDAALVPSVDTLSAEHSSSSSLEQLRSPNTIGVTYFPYVRHSIVKKYELDGSLVSATTTNTEYDSYGNAVMVVTSTSDGYAQTTYSSYINDASQWFLGRLVESQVTAESPGQPPQTRTSSFTYSAESGMLIRETTEPDTSSLTLHKTYWHDGYGNITHSATTDHAGVVHTLQQTDYDSRGRFAVKSINALGHSEERIYDELLGVQTRLTGPNGLATSWEYDSFGRITKETRADGTSTTTTYHHCDALDCPSGADYAVRTAADGVAPVIVYHDLLDRPIREEMVGFDGRPIYIDTTYNTLGQVTQVAEPYFVDETPVWTSYTYDVLGRVLTQTNPDGNHIATRYQGFTVEVTNARNQVVTRTVNSQDQTVQSTDALGHTISYTYDAFGNLVTVTDHVGNATTMAYDLRGRKTTMTDPDMGTVTYRYNAVDELIWQQDARGNEVEIVYDALGRVLGRREAEGTSIWTYDTQPHGIGKPAEVSGPHGYREVYTYDEFGRPTATTTTIDEETFVMHTGYDQFSRPDHLIYPTGFAIQNTYTEYGHLKDVRNRTTGTVYWQARAINARGQIETAQLGNGLAVNQRYNPLNGRIATIQTSDPESSVLVQNLAYEFDALGNLTSRTDHIQNLTEAFQYDELNRLTRAQVGSRQAQTVAYDDLGNITSRSDVGSYTYGENDAGPHAVTSITGVQNETYTYDASGNRLTSSTGSIEYTSFNVPARITANNSTRRTTFTYSPDHNRYKQVLERGSVITTTLYIGGSYEREQEQLRDLDDVFSARHRHYIPGGDGVIAIYTQERDGSEETRYLHRDHIGSVDTITDENGSIVEKLSYDAWGQRRLSSWQPAPNELTSQVSRGFTGHEMLDEVGLIHMGGRVYDPLIGRFLSADPFVQAPENLQSLNRYSYVLNNPLSLTDPSGFFSIGDFFDDIGDAIGDAVDFIKDNWKTIAVVGLTIAAGWAAGMLAPALGFAKGGLGAAIIGGAAGGFVGGFSGTMLYGGSLSQALKAGFRGALISGISAGLTHGIGGALGHQVPFGSGNHVKKIIAHGAVGGLRSVAQGGKFEHGFMSGAVTATFAPGINHIKGQGYRVAAAALVGGTAAELGGGKFANGAITGAFVQMFNDEVKGYLHKRINLKGGWRALTEEGGVYEFKDIEGFFSVEAADAAMHADKVMGRIWMIPIEAVKYALVGWPAIIVDIGVTKFDLWEAFVPYDYIHPGHIRVRTTVLEGNSLYDNHIGLIHNETRNYKPGDSGYEYYRGLLLH